MTNKIVLFIFILSLLISCTESGGNGFSGLEGTPEEGLESNSTPEEAVEIISFTPNTDPYVLISNQTQTYAVQVNSGSGDVNYSFRLDGVLVANSNSPFYSFNSNLLSAGSHTLEVVAENSIGSDSHTFNLSRNSAPTVTLFSATSNTINCIGDTYTLNVSISDADGDSLTSSFLLNGGSSPSFLTSSSSASSATVTFSPDCSLSGSNTITIRVTDQNGETADYSAAVTVTNPNVASIDSYSPTANPVVILSSETKNFIVSASGNPPLSYSWDISPGSTIASCNNSTACDISGGDFSPGNYTLTTTVTDSISSTDSHTFNVILNERPSISFNTPSNSNKIKMNCSSSKSFQINVQDANYSDGQSFTIQWLVDGLSNPSLTNTNNLATYPMVSDATFSPNCASLLMGDHTISAIVNDGYESQQIDWDVSVNYFSDECNNLNAGEICTISGLLGQGSGIDTSTQNDQVRIRPEFIAKYPSGGFFFTEGYRHAVWFYNNTASPVIVFGKTIAANTIKSLFGSTQYGVGTDGQTFNSFYLRDPRGIVYSSSEDALYVAEYNNHRIVRFNSSGAGYRWAAGGSSNTDGATRVSAKCRNPVGLALDESEGKLFAACYGNTGGSDGAFKYFMTGSDQAYTLLRYNGNTTDGSIGYSGSARSPRAYSLAMDPNDKILYAGDLSRCRIMAVTYSSDSASFHGGALTLSTGQMKRILRGGACGETLNRAWNDTAGRIRPYALEVFSEGGVTKGIFWSQYNRHFVGFFNLTTSSITIGGRTIAGGFYNTFWGRNNVADYARGTPSYTNTLARNPFGLIVEGSTLYIADRGNYRIGSFNLTTENSSDLVGNLFTGDYDDELAKHSNARRYNNPRAIEFDQNTNSILIADNGNRRIRKMSLDTGLVTTLIGRGAYGNSNTDPEDPQDAYMQNLGDLNISDDGSFLFYTDYNGGNGTNRNCLGRAFNQTSSTQTLFNQVIPADKLYSVIGNFALGCNTWSSASYNNTSAISARLDYPIGITSLTDQSELYVSDYDADIIYKVNSSGTISEFIGIPNNNGDINGAYASAKLYRPGDLQLDSNSVAKANGNFFVVDRWINTNSYIKYVNQGASSISIFGLTLNPGEITKIISSDGYVGGVTSFADQICYTQGANANGHQYPHNVICLNRDTGLTTLRVGKISASTVKCATPEYNEEEGILASSSSLCGPWGITFDNEGNLYISESRSNNIRMVKRWY